MAIFLIRHGQTALNAARVIQHPHTPLNARGLEQARRLGERMAREAIGLIVSSDYARTHQTAEGVEAGTGARLEFNPNLRERNFGDIRGTAYDDHEEDVFAEGYRPAGGESWPVFHRRVDQAWSEMVATAAGVDGDIAVVTHGLVCNSLFDRVFSLSPETVQQGWVVANTSVTIVEPEPPFRVHLLACATHLDGMD